MKKVAIRLMVMSLTFALVFTSCRNKEDADPAVSNAEMEETKTHSADNDDATANLDDAMDIVNTDLSGVSGARVEGTEACGYTANYSAFSTVSGTNQKTIIYTFDKNSTCSSRSRQGTITVTLVQGNYFREQGAVYNLVFEGYGVTYNGKMMTLTGTQTVTNVTGGLPRSRFVDGSIVTHKVSGNMELAFDGFEGTRNWQINREITWANTAGILSFSISSDNSVDELNNVSVWGTNRFGNKFYTQITTPIVANSNCGWYRPTSGTRVHILKDADESIKFTVTVTNNLGANLCGNGYSVTTTNKRGRTREVTVTY